MEDTSYSKADLLWEATRRNEEYKSFYNQVAGPVNETEYRWNRTWHPGNYRWKIHGLLHPSLSVDDIHAEIKAGADPNKVHPYYYMFKNEHKAILQHHVPTIESKYYDKQNRPQDDGKFDLAADDRLQDDLKIDSTDYKRYQEFRAIVKDRILLSINPMATDKDIIDEIKKLKKEKRIVLRHEVNTLKAKGKRSYYPRDINKYIGWLLKYTEIVEYLTQKIGAHGLKISDGIVALTEDFSFNEVVPNDIPGEKFEGQRKAYRTAYLESINLIRLSPNITFQAHRTQK